jgi:glycosyltransferase involved in cell wall biosynthesis
VNDPVVSILICTRNRCAELRATLASFARIEVPNDLPTELIVIDNGSTDATKDVVEQTRLPQLPIRSVLEPQAGQARARNRGIAEAKGRYILFTDDDVRPPTNWIAGMCSPLQRGECDAVAGGVRIALDLLRDWMSARDRSWLASTERLDPQQPTELVGANFGFVRDVLRRVPGFDIELGPGALGFGDDTLFAWKLQAAGLRIGSALDVEVEHHFSADRLSRASFLSMAKRFGTTEGHLLRVWHRKLIRRPRMQAFGKLMMLSLLRLKHWPSRRREGISDWEGSLVSEYHALRQYARESRLHAQQPVGELSVQWI